MRKNGVGVMIAEFKARLSHYLKGVRSGGRLTIYDRDTPVAVVLPYNKGASRELVIRQPVRVPKQVKIHRLSRKINSLHLLQEERGERLS